MIEILSSEPELPVSKLTVLSSERIPLLLLLILFFAFAGCASQETPAQDIPSFERTHIATDDGSYVRGTLYLPVQPNGADVLLLHSFGRTREDWAAFAELLKAAGYTVYAIDFRGHGMSDGGPYEWKTFTDADSPKFVLDAKAAREFMQRRSNHTRLAIVGSSIGANVALKYAASDPGVNALVLLSPGENYKGLDISQDVAKYGDRPAMVIVSKYDTYSYQSVQKLFSSPSAEKATMFFEGTGHGTEMLSQAPQLPGAIIDWLGANLR